MRAPFSFWRSSGGGSVPVVTAVSYGVVRTAGGGQREVVTVNSSTGCTAIKIGGVACTSFAIDDATHASGIPGAHAAGVVNVVVTNAAGDSTTGTGLVEYWSPAEENLSLLNMPGGYAIGAGGTWAGVASAGSSGGRDLTEATNYPAASSGNPVFDGVNDRLVSALTLANLFTTGYSIVAFVNAASLAADSGEDASPGIFGDAGSYFKLTLEASGAKIYHYDTLVGVNPTPHVAVATGTPTMIRGKWNGTNAYVGTGVSAWSTPTATNGPGSTTGTIKAGANYNGTSFVNMTGTLLAVSPVAFSDAVFGKFYGWGRQSGLLP